ncbi:MAG: hypothetical protein MI810_21000 [Flavobacteriales bacterium]|nr:hypothetical protein [Flavobacteriales bacterium]
MPVYFEATPLNDESLSYLTMGYFHFEKEGVTLSNRNKKPDQAAMLLASLDSLLDRLVAFKKGSLRKAVFSPLDCSYELLLEFSKGKVKLSEFGKVVLTFDLDELAKGVWEAYHDLLNQHNVELIDMSEATQDLEKSLKVFAEVFSFSVE